MTAASARHRVTRAAETFRSAAASIGPVEPGMALFLVTRGQFSMIDVVLHVLDQIGPASVALWTWAIADYEVEALAGLLARQAITSGTLIVDRSAEVRSVATIDAWRQRFGAETVKVCKTHAKIARIGNDRVRVVARGSCNLNWNPRFEQIDITEGGPEFDLLARLEAELPVLQRLCTNREADGASGLGLAFEASQLAAFQGVKPWRP